MPTPPKTTANMAKHLTREELEARAQAEADFLPTRTPAPPKGFTVKSAERRIWDRIIQDMEGYKILDRLDTDVLEIYCRQLVRLKTLRSMFDRMVDADEWPIKTVLSTSAEIKGLEGTILSYATKLGLTPESRARLALNAVEPPDEDPDGDMFA